MRTEHVNEEIPEVPTPQFPNGIRSKAQLAGILDTLEAPTTNAILEAGRKQFLDEDKACMLVTNSKRMVYCRACQVTIQLGGRKAVTGGYHTYAWVRHRMSPRHELRLEQWRGKGGDKIDKSEDIQWEAVVSRTRQPDGTFNEDLVLREIIVGNQPEVATSAKEAGTSAEATEEEDAIFNPNDYNAQELIIAEKLAKLRTLTAEDGAAEHTAVELMLAKELLNLRSGAA
ncbi:hypothetical protein MD484_g7846, partial [Candolleomyces efflorescens]